MSKSKNLKYDRSRYNHPQIIDTSYSEEEQQEREYQRRLKEVERGRKKRYRRSDVAGWNGASDLATKLSEVFAGTLMMKRAEEIHKKRGRRPRITTTIVSFDLNSEGIGMHCSDNRINKRVVTSGAALEQVNQKRSSAGLRTIKKPKPKRVPKGKGYMKQSSTGSGAIVHVSN